jgi:hypothetical protein
MFEKALKQKLRFDTSKGSISTEDLWDLSLASLNEIAKEVNKKIKASEEESFIDTKTTTSTKDQLKLEIIKFVIADKIATRDAAKARAEKQAQVAKIKSLIANKADEQLANASLEELSDMLAQAGAEEVEQDS